MSPPARAQTRRQMEDIELFGAICRLQWSVGVCCGGGGGKERRNICKAPPPREGGDAGVDGRVKKSASGVPGAKTMAGRRWKWKGRKGKEEMESLLCRWSEGAQEGNILVPNKAGIHGNSSLREVEKKKKLNKTTKQTSKLYLSSW